ncbi:hypothetical protein E2320_003280 [Naja naja]|nr:hypothetical protein E2320_003280 [Naja naja]
MRFRCTDAELVLGEQSRLVAWFFLAFTYSTPSGPGLWNSAAMEKSRCLIQQVIGHKVLFVVFLLFLTDILVEVVAITNVTINTTASLNISASPFPASPQMTEESSLTSVISPPDAIMLGNLTRSLSTPGQPKLSLSATPQVSKQKLQSSMPVNTAVPEDTSSPMRSEVIVSTKGKHPPAEATEVQKSKPPPAPKEVPSEGSLNISASPFPASPQMTEESSLTSVISPPDAIMLGNLTRSLSTPGQPKLSLSATPQVSKQKLQCFMPVNTAVSEDTSSPMRSEVIGKGKHLPTEATEVQKSKPPPAPKEVPSEGSLNISASPFPASPQMTEESSLTSVISPPDAIMLGNLTRSLSTPGQSKLSLSATPQVSKQKLQSSMPVNIAVPEDTSSPMRSEVIVSTKGKHPPAEATEVQKSKPPPAQKEVPSKTTVIPHFDNETVSSPTKDLEPRSQESFFEKSPSTIAYPETTKSTEPKDDRKGPTPPSQAVPELTQAPETGSHYMFGPFTTSLTPINNDSTDKRLSGKKTSVIILVVVLSILLLLGLLAILYFKRRHHSGSTSFNSPEWAGQATLPDDTGLDKDVEQQVGSVGEGETRRGTLVTFFGKRQSRVPSIAMEDINGKGGKEETEKLLCGDAEKGNENL